MAYTNAIFYLDLVNGSDATRTSLTGCIASNPSGTITRINKTAHGLVTGAIVNLTSFSTWLNNAWKITVVDNDNFDLDDAVWQTTADINGTVTPRGGSSWSDAWLTTTNGVTASRVQAGDTIRYAKSADPTSIGNATWTSGSATVTLATAQTENIYLDGSWTAANSGAATTNTTRKEGSDASQITTAASTATNTKYAYYTIGGGSGVDLSSYDSITFWIQNRSVAVNANNYQIKLCSDTTGDTAVDTFDIPAISSNNLWVPLTLTRVGGGALGSSIQSIAWYTGSVSPGNSRQVYIDDVLACEEAGLNLTSLISKNSSGYTNPTSSDTWHGLQSINGTTVILANMNATPADSANLKGYYTTGTSPDTVTTYIRPTIKIPLAAAGVSTERINKSGSAGSLITYSGGWNTSTTTQDGDTWIDAQNGAPNGMSGFNINYWKTERINFVRFGNSFNNGSSTSSIGCDISAITINSGSGGSMFFSNSNITLYSNNNNTAFAGALSSPEVFNNNVSSLISRNNYGTSSFGGNNCVINYFEAVNGGGASIVTANSVMYINTMILDSLNNALQALDGGNGSSSRYYIDNFTITNSTSAFANSPLNLTVNKLTASGITNLGAGYNLIVKNLNASTSQIVGSDMGTPSSVLRTSQPTAFYSNINNVQTDNRAYWSYGNALSQTTERHSASGIAWQINITDSAQTSTFPVNYPIAQVACNANSLVTVKAWVKKSHATDIAAQLLLEAYEIAGVTADVTASKSNDTNWEELTITFTPTLQGVVQIYLSAWWVANAATQSVYVDDITVTQA